MLSEFFIIIHLLVANDAEEVPDTAMHFPHVAGVHRVAIETHTTRSALSDAGVVVKSLNVGLEVFLVTIGSGAIKADPSTVLVGTVQVVCQGHLCFERGQALRAIISDVCLRMAILHVLPQVAGRKAAFIANSTLVGPNHFGRFCGRLVSKTQRQPCPRR